MIGPRSPEISKLSEAAARRVDAVCDRWEAALQSSGPCRPEDYLATVEQSARPALLRQLLLLEWEYRQQHGERLDLSDYLVRFPEHSRLIQQASEEHNVEIESLSGFCNEANRAVSPRADFATQEWEDQGYVLLSELGSGGMGAVYLARQTSADRLVAVKQLHNTHNAGVDRFRREARILSRLEHPHIVPIYEVGHCRGRPFYSMEYCSGGSLAEYLRRTRPTPLESAALLEMLARAVHSAHEARVIHRDLKPGNVLLQPNSADTSATAAAILSYIPKLADFGLAKRLEVTAQTRTGELLGTPQYMAPEQVRGENKGVGLATDIHALGTILYECLTGRPPFQGATLWETVLQVLSEDATPPSRVQQLVPRDLETICLACLHKEPRRRYPSAAHLAEDLRRFRGGQPIRVRSLGAGERIWKWLHRHRAAALLAVLLLSGLVGLLLAAWAVGERIAATASLEGQVEASARADREEGRAQREKALRMYAQALSVADREGPGSSLLRLAYALQTAVQAQADDLEQSIRMQIGAWRRDLQPLRGVLVHQDCIFAVAFCPDGKTILTGSRDKTARQWDAATGEPKGPPLEHRDAVYAVAFSPDGNTLLTGSGDHTAQLWDASTGQPRGPPLRHQDRVLAVAFSPDGKTVATGSDRTAQLWDAATSMPLSITLPHDDIVRALVFSPDGKTILTGSSDKTARLWEAETGQPVGPRLQHRYAVFAVDYSPDGKLVFTGDRGNTGQLWDAATGRKVGKPLQHRAGVMAVRFSPSGKLLLTGSDDSTARVWEARTGQPLGPPLKHHDYVRAVAFSPSGKTMLTGCFDGNARLWELNLPIKQSWTRHTLRSMAYSPDHRLLLTGHDNGKVQLWNADSGQRVAPPLQQQGRIFVVAFSPDGQQMMTRDETSAVRLWDAATGQPVGSPLQHPNDASGYRPLSEFGRRAAAFSPDGKKLLVAHANSIAQVWDVATGRPTGPTLHHESGVQALAFSPDAKTIVTGSWEGAARLWQTATGQPDLAPMQHRKPVVAVAYSPDCRLVATGSHDGTARLWDGTTAKPFGPVLLHPDLVTDVAFSPDGKTLLTACYDMTVRLWQVATGKPLGPPLQHQHSRLRFLGFTPDGRTILTAGANQTVVRRWRVFPAAEGEPKQILLSIQVETGLELDEHDNLRALDGPTWKKRRQELDRGRGFSAQAANLRGSSLPLRPR